MALKHPNAIPAGLIPAGTDDNFDYYAKYEASGNTLNFYSDPEGTEATTPPGCVTDKNKKFGHILVMTNNSEGTFADPAVTWEGQVPNTTPPPPISAVTRSTEGEGFSFVDDNDPRPENTTTYHFTIWVHPNAGGNPTGHEEVAPQAVPMGPGPVVIGFGPSGTEHGFDPTVVNKGEYGGDGGTGS